MRPDGSLDGMGSSIIGEDSMDAGGCGKCLNRFPKASNKLPVCGGCRSTSYCSEACQRDDWPHHITVCKEIFANQQREVARYAEHGAPGNAKRNLKRAGDAVKKWFSTAPAPGLTNKLQFLA